MKQAIPWLISLVLVIFLVVDGRAKPKPVIPHIETVYETVTVTPAWLADSQKVWKKQVHTTDTVEIVISNTILAHDTVYLGADTSLRPEIWPITEYHGGTEFGDTALITTFSVRSGVQAVSRVFVPGILTDLSADSGSVPKITFAPFPEPRKPPLLYSLKMVGIGFGACTALHGVP